MKEEIKKRSKDLAIAIINYVGTFTRYHIAGKHIAKQMIRSATSVAANYRAVCRARSDKEFIAKLEIVIEEADETMLWLEVISEKEWISNKQIEVLYEEMNQLLSIFISSAKTIKKRIAQL